MYHDLTGAWPQLPPAYHVGDKPPFMFLCSWHIRVYAAHLDEAEAEATIESVICALYGELGNRGLTLQKSATPIS